MKKLLGAVCLTAVGVGLAGCVTPGAGPSVPSETRYVSPKKEAIQPLEYQGIVAVLRDVGGFYGSWSDGDIRTAVDLTCDGFANNKSSENIRDTISKKIGAESTRHAFEVQQVMSAAVGIRCEEYDSKKSEITSWNVSL